MPIVTFDNLSALWIAVTLALTACAMTIVRRPTLPRSSFVVLGLGMILLTLAAGGPTWHRVTVQPVTVMVDLSPSTRTATFRQRQALESRVSELLNGAPYRLMFFASGTPAQVDASNPVLPDIPADRTVFAPPDALAILLFTDGRFARPAVAPPTFVVVDPQLEAPLDAAVTSIEIRDTEVTVATSNGGVPRSLRLAGLPGATTLALPAGAVVTSRSRPANATGAVSATIAPGDAWPENDAMAAFIPPPARAQRWWVGTSSAPDDSWRSFTPTALPFDPAAYLAPAIIVLDDVPAAALSLPHQQRLQQYVRDLGGGLLILGGDHAFAPGGYSGTILEQLSPLASMPPEPTAHWLLLADGSGSMNQPANGSTRWQTAADAIARLIPALPPADLVSAGSFGDSVTWWTRYTPAHDAAVASLPPATAHATGATKLREALETAVASVNPALPTELLLLTDANADLGEEASLSQALQAKKIRLHVLLIGEDGGGADALRRLVKEGGGTALTELDPQKWADAVKRLMRGARPDPMLREAREVRYIAGLSTLPARRVGPLNRTWLNRGAIALGEASVENDRTVAVARRGDDDRVGAVAFKPNAAELSSLANMLERPPGDPRLHVTWETHPRLRVTVDALQGQTYLNGLQLSVQLFDERGDPRLTRLPIPQVAPGRYAWETDAPAEPLLAALEGPSGTIARAAIAGRYPPEFDAIGNDRRMMEDLANRTGGAVIEPEDHRPLKLPRPHRDVPLVSWLATAGALCIACGLVVWKLS